MKKRNSVWVVEVRWPDNEWRAIATCGFYREHQEAFETASNLRSNASPEVRYRAAEYVRVEPKARKLVKRRKL